MKPVYKHDCPKCKFVLGSRNFDDSHTDWYVCEGGDPSVLGRFGNEGPEYVSWPRDMVELNGFTDPVPLFDGKSAVVSEPRIVAAYVLAKYKENQA